MHPQPRVRSLSEAHERSHHRYTGVNPAFPARWFYGLFRALPGERILVVTVTSGLKAQSNPVGLDVASASLAPATGVGTTRLCRPLKRRSSRAPSIAHEVHLALRPTIAPDALASTASRPALVTTRDRPSVGRDAIDIDLILVKRIRKYFCKWGWTGAPAKHQLICPSGKISIHSCRAAFLPLTSGSPCLFARNTHGDECDPIAKGSSCP
jgi:hypothetical protein